MALSGIKAILERYWGTLGVSSEEGVGSTFTVRLPLAQAESLVTSIN